MSEYEGKFSDAAAELQQGAIDQQVARIRANAFIAPGFPGECDYCGNESPRLVGGACATCRDKRGLP